MGSCMRGCVIRYFPLRTYLGVADGGADERGLVRRKVRDLREGRAATLLYL